mgnify:FL=1
MKKAANHANFAQLTAVLNGTPCPRGMLRALLAALTAEPLPERSDHGEEKAQVLVR